MQLSTKHGFAFLCMYKCASTSIEVAIRKASNVRLSGHPALKHINARDFSSYILAAHEKLLPSIKIESFCLIRNPLEWIESWYRFRTREVLKDPNHRNHKNYTGHITYNEFIEAFISKEKRPSFARLSTQYDFVKSANNEIALDYIFPLDNLDLVENFLNKKIGKTVTIPSKNISPKIAIELDEGLKNRLVEYLANDIALYNFVISHGHFIKRFHSKKIVIPHLDNKP